MDPDANHKAQGKPTLMQLDGGSARTLNGDGGSIQDDDTLNVPHCTYTEADDSIEVNVKLNEILPADIQGTVPFTKKNVEVKIQSKQLKVSIKGYSDAVWSVNLAGSISPDDSTWTFSGTVINMTVAMELEKSDGKLWNRLQAM